MTETGEDYNWECMLCGAPGGYPYCNSRCEAADNPDDNEE